MDDLISRQAAIDGADAIIARDTSGNNDVVKAMTAWKSYVEALPSAQPERKKGRWIRNDNGTYSCSVCQSWIPKEQHHYARYCLYCGADMRGEE